jgi:hypothetical protein
MLTKLFSEELRCKQPQGLRHQLMASSGAQSANPPSPAPQSPQRKHFSVTLTCASGPSKSKQGQQAELTCGIRV